MRSTQLILASIVVVVCSEAALSQAKEDLAAQINRLAKPYITSEVAKGLSIGVIRGEQQAIVHLGQVSDGRGVPSDDTVYEIGSISKVFTGILLGDAVAEDKLKLNQPAGDLLPREVTMPVWKEQPITLLHLSTHASGLPRLPNNMGNVPGNPYSQYTSRRAYEFLASHQLRRGPNEKGEYSNFAVSLLGHLLCRSAGKDYDELLSDRITGPLKMSDTSVKLTDSMRSRLATGHNAAGIATSTWEFADMPGAGGIRSTLMDMMRFAKANLNSKDASNHEALELAWQQHRDGTANEFAMGLGWHIARDGSTRWHNGQTGGYHSALFVNRPLNIAVVLLCNTSTMEVDRLAEDTVQMLAGQPVRPREFKQHLEVSDEVMQRYAGRYQLAPGFEFTVSVKGSRLLVGLTGQPTFQVFPKSETNWYYKVVKAELTFDVDDAGKCQSLELFQNGIRQTAKRID